MCLEQHIINSLDIRCRRLGIRTAVDTCWCEIYVGALYHPPRSQYATNSLLDYIEENVNELNSAHPAATITMASDFNQLADNDIIERTGLTLIVHQPT